eukprot:TRINITY_DN56513_c0_g1_i1.p1 TRINITY_DN56513_c0_g1~~TRINITY_DN56513_c0_g1_i1.p1  ORF type:complete len:257 (+),score=38.98 TRINITY_DN56513_c0_g1_i1:84-854(+)
MGAAQRQLARCCGKLPGVTGLACYVGCCVMPCKGLRKFWNKLTGADKAEEQEALLRARAEVPFAGTRRVLILGLDGVGKSCFMWMCEHPQASSLEGDAPGGATMGVRRFTRKSVVASDGSFSVDLDLCEVGGGEKVRPYWKHYAAPDLDVVAVFIAAADLQTARLDEAAVHLVPAWTEIQRRSPRLKLCLVVCGDEGVAGGAALKQFQDALSRAGSPEAGRLMSRTSELRCGDLKTSSARRFTDDLLQALASLAGD